MIKSEHFRIRFRVYRDTSGRGHLDTSGTGGGGSILVRLNRTHSNINLYTLTFPKQQQEREIITIITKKGSYFSAILPA